jgi:hypothetical protein
MLKYLCSISLKKNKKMTIKLMFSAAVQNSKEILRFIKEFNSDLFFWKWR